MPNGHPGMDLRNCLKGVSKFSFFLSLKSGKTTHFEQQKLLIFAKMEGVYQPNIRENGIFSVPEIKHGYALR